MRKIFISFAAVALLATTACSDFLDIQPVSAVSEAKLLNPEGVEMIKTGMYSTLYASSIQQSLASVGYGDVIGGNANKGSNATDQPPWGELEVYTFSGTNGYITGPWAHFYNGVFRANKVLDVLGKTEGLTDAYVTQSTAEARFFRGLYHLEAVMYFGAAVPYVDLEAFQSNVSPMVGNVDEAGNYIYIWDKIIEDFTFAYENLPASYGSSELGRPNKYAALAYRAKTRVFQSSPYNGKNGTNPSNWAAAKIDLETLISEGITSKGDRYSLYSKYGEFFSSRHDNTPEAVFAIQQAITGTNTNGSTVWGSGQYNGLSNMSGWGFSQPSTDMAQSYQVDANGVPLLNNAYRTLPPKSVRGSGSTVNTDLTAYMDPRIDYVLGRFGVPFKDWDVPTSTDGYVRDVNNGGIYFPKKWLPSSADKSSSSLSVVGSSTSTVMNVNLIRYADILLWYAEALVQTGTPAAAEDYVNQVRERAGNQFVGAMVSVGGKFNTGVAATTSAYVMDNKFDVAKSGVNAAANYRIGPWPSSQFATEEGAMEAIRYESRAEFAMEGRYWFDLCRWGIAKEQLDGYTAYEKNFLTKFTNKFYNDAYICLPIPSRQITIMSPILKQSESWSF